MHTPKLRIAILGLMTALAVFGARSHRRGSGQNATGQFDYYLLSLSWAPDFCAQPGGNKSPNECGVGRHIGFVVHGLWPQGNTGRGPENCGNASPVAQSIVTLMLKYIPTASLIQHEWSAHGTCSGLGASDFFAAVRQARDAVRIPARFTSLTGQTQDSASGIDA